MKVVFFLLAIVPFIVARSLTPEEERIYKRWVLGGLTAETPEPKLFELLGSYTTEAACEAACHQALNALVPGAGFLASSLCVSACNRVQTHLG